MVNGHAYCEILNQVGKNQEFNPQGSFSVPPESSRGILKSLFQRKIPEGLDASNAFRAMVLILSCSFGKTFISQGIHHLSKKAGYSPLFVYCFLLFEFCSALVAHRQFSGNIPNHYQFCQWLNYRNIRFP